MFEDLRVKNNFYRFCYEDTKPFKVYKIYQWQNGRLLECCIRDKNGKKIDYVLSKSRVLYYLYNSHYTTEILEALQ